MDLNLFGGLTDIAKEFITDKDKLAEFNLKAKEAELEFKSELLKNKTHPFVDALVKLMIALSPLIEKAWRPVGTALLTLFAGYCSVEGVQLPEYVHEALYAAFPGWGIARHADKRMENKSKEKIALEKERTKQTRPDFSWDDDF